MTNDMRSFRQGMGRAAACALTLVLATAPLVACGGSSSSNGSTASSATSAATSTTALVDVASWKTLADAYAVKTSSVTAGWNDDYFVGVFQGGDAYYRVVAKMDEESAKKIDATSAVDPDYEKKFDEASGGMAIVSAEDITPDLVSQDELDALVGKTGAEIEAAGYTFCHYSWFDDEQVGAGYDKGHFCYTFTYDMVISDDQAEDDGAILKDAVVVAAELEGPADSAVNPDMV